MLFILLLPVPYSRQGASYRLRRFQFFRTHIHGENSTSTQVRASHNYWPLFPFTFLRRGIKAVIKLFDSFFPPCFKYFLPSLLPFPFVSPAIFGSSCLPTQHYLQLTTSIPVSLDRKHGINPPYLYFTFSLGGPSAQ